MSLFGRILTITDVFDAITSVRIYRPAAVSSNRALAMMLDRGGTDFDPILIKVFVNMLGVYPVGILLLWDTGEIGPVAQSSELSDRTRPQIVLLVPDGQHGFAKGTTISLAERDPKTGLCRRNVTDTLQPSAFGIQPAEFLL